MESLIWTKYLVVPFEDKRVVFTDIYEKVLIMNRYFTSLVVLLSLSLSLLAQGFGERQLLNDNWSFQQGDLKYGGREFLDHSNWRKLDLPHDWSVEGTASQELSSCTGYLPGGIAWYRKDLDIPASRDGQKVYVYFEGVYNKSEVFINGKWLGIRPNGYISFMYDITPYLNFGGRNALAVRVDHSDQADSRWYTGSGIYRDVYLVYANPIHIDLWGVYCNAEVTGDSAQITVETDIVNTSYKSAAEVSVAVVQELYDIKGNKIAAVETEQAIAQEGKIVQEFMLSKPKLWSLDSPYLYTLKTTVKQGGKVIDTVKTKAGIRKLTFDANTGFALNDKPMKFKGVCIHHDAGCLGSAVPRTVWRRRLENLKSLGCNAIRMSHNPQATDVYDICDEIGLLVMDEAFDEWEYPKKKWLEGWNVGKPGFQGSANYFRQWCKRDLADMVRRDRNHPSIIMWSIGNEIDYPNDPYSHDVLNDAGIGQIHVAGYKTTQPHANRLGEIAKELVEVVKQYDQSRPVTAALAGAVMSNYTQYPFVLDVVGYNYTEDRYKIDHEKYPQRILYGSENRHDYNAWRAVADNEFIMGQFLWTGIDYLGEAGRWPSRGSTSGLLDRAGYPKSLAYYRKSLWAEEPFVYIGSSRIGRRDRGPSMWVSPSWNYSDDAKVRVVCFTNCDEAELVLNSKVVGERKQRDQQNGLIYWDIDYAPGELEVRAYNGSQKQVSHKLETVGEPAAIKAVADVDSFKKAGQVAHVEISIVDDQGRLVSRAGDELQFELSENLRLLGSEDGSNDPQVNFKDNVHNCQGGRLLLYIQSKDPSSKGKITISGSGFKDVVIEL